MNEIFYSNNTPCFNGTIERLPELEVVNGKTVYYYYDIMAGLDNQLAFNLLKFSVILLLYVIFNYYFIEPIISKSLKEKPYFYWPYVLSHIFALVSALYLFVLTLIYLMKWRI